MCFSNFVIFLFSCYGLQNCVYLLNVEKQISRLRCFGPCLKLFSQSRHKNKRFRLLLLLRNWANLKIKNKSKLLKFASNFTGQCLMTSFLLSFIIYISASKPALNGPILIGVESSVCGFELQINVMIRQRSPDIYSNVDYLRTHRKLVIMAWFSRWPVLRY